MLLKFITSLVLCVLFAPGQVFAIIGGEAIDTEEGVYFVRITTQSGEVVGCTGVAISEHMILSAAHCVAVGFVNYDATIEVLLGSNHRIENAEYLPVARQYLHPDFQQSDLPAGSDLAILVVDEALPNYRSYREESLPAVSELEAIGYGLGFFDDEAGVSGGVQRKAILSVVEQSDKKIKVGNLEATPCYGDSGAPLFFEDQVVAILSHGIRGCREGMTAVLVAPHFDFLDSVSAQESDLSGGEGCSVTHSSSFFSFPLSIILFVLGLFLTKYKK